LGENYFGKNSRTEIDHFKSVNRFTLFQFRPTFEHFSRFLATLVVGYDEIVAIERPLCSNEFAGLVERFFRAEP